MVSPQEGPLKVKIGYMPPISFAVFVLCSFSDRRQQHFINQQY